MSIQKKLIEDILSSYDTILERRNFIQESSLVKLSDTGYSNLGHDNDGTQNDSVNKALLDDIQTAAKSLGIVATITTAKTGHNQTVKGSSNISRHMNGTGVDVAILDGIGSGGATNANNGNREFRELGNKLKNALVSMGYVWNVESGNDKAVLWQTNTGGNHFNHLHISNKSGVSSEAPTVSSDDTSSDDSNDITSNINTDTSSEDKSSKPTVGDFAAKFGEKILNAIGIKESSKEKKINENIEKIKKLL